MLAFSDYLGILQRITDYYTSKKRIIDYLDLILEFKDIDKHRVVN